MRSTADRTPTIAYETVVRGRSRSQPWLVLLSGVAHDRHSWAPVVDGFAQRFRLVLIDNRGVGQSDGGGITVPILARDVLTVLDDLGLERPHVLGFSLGGMIAQELAMRAAERVDRLVLVATTPGMPSRLLFPPGNIASFWQALLQPGEESLRRVLIRGLSERTLEERPEVLEQVLGYHLAHPTRRRTVLAQSQAGTMWTGPTPFSPIRVPTLIVQGTDDRVVDPGNVGQLTRVLDHAEVALLADTGHLVPWEQPTRLVGEVTAFLSPVVSAQARRPVPATALASSSRVVLGAFHWVTDVLRSLVGGLQQLGRRLLRGLHRRL